MTWLLRILGAMVCFLAPPIIQAASAAESAALAGLEAINRNQGARFVAVAHPTLIQKIRDIVIANVGAAAQPDPPLPELKDYGVTNLGELQKLSAETVARLTVDHMSDAELPSLRETMHAAKFSVVKSKPISADTVLVTVSFEMESGGRRQTQTVEVISKLAGAVWKYWGLPEPLKV